MKSISDLCSGEPTLLFLGVPSPNPLLPSQSRSLGPDFASPNPLLPLQSRSLGPDFASKKRRAFRDGTDKVKYSGGVSKWGAFRAVVTQVAFAMLKVRADA